MRPFFLPVLVLLAAFASGCDLTTAEDARVQIQITDAPSDYIESAEVWISRVYLKCEDDDGEDEGEHLLQSVQYVRSDSLKHDDDDDDDDDDVEDDDELCERVDLFNDPDSPFHVDLLGLRDGLVANLTVPVDLPAGVYHKLYVVVDSAAVTMKAPHTFPDGSATARLRIAGKGHKAIKVELAEPIDVAAGETALVLVDFDVNESFRILGSPNGAGGIKGVLFLPRLKEKHRHERHD